MSTGTTIEDLVRLAMSREMTQQEAIDIAKTRWWLDVPQTLATWLQLNQERLAMDMDAFHSALEELLGRPVWTHELADRDRLIAEASDRSSEPL